MGRSPFIGDKPLDSIVLAFEGGYSGYKEYNSPSDPMPIKTMNNNGLQVLEEVPGEYKIYIDKDAVMTTVAKYAPGSYQTFMERKADVDNSRSLLKGYNIEWNQKDDSDLFIQCNNEAISKIENQPMTLDEPTQPVVLEPKTVPTTYDCCFRVGKEGVYVGEGYENLANELMRDINISGVGQVNTTSGGIYNALVNIGDKFSMSVIDSKSEIPTQRFTIRIIQNDTSSYYFDATDGRTTLATGTYQVPEGVYKISVTTWLQTALYNNYQWRGFQITKTSTPKPFVKSVMPSGKLDRISNANETTHTFLNKGDGVVTFGNGYFSLKGDNIQQFLVYKGILTEEQKQTELNKTFKVR